MSGILLACPPNPIREVERRFDGRAMIYFYRALFSHLNDQLVQWFLTWDSGENRLKEMHVSVS